MVVVVAQGLAIFEITLGGARPAVLSFLGAILLSPIFMRIDEARRSHGATGDPAVHVHDDVAGHGAGSGPAGGGG
jgi:hypothetical protein